MGFSAKEIMRKFLPVEGAQTYFNTVQTSLWSLLTLLHPLLPPLIQANCFFTLHVSSKYFSSFVSFLHHSLFWVVLCPFLCLFKSHSHPWSSSGKLTNHLKIPPACVWPWEKGLYFSVGVSYKLQNRNGIAYTAPGGTGSLKSVVL